MNHNERKAIKEALNNLPLFKDIFLQFHRYGRPIREEFIKRLINIHNHMIEGQESPSKEV